MTSSVAGLVPIPQWSVYCATKWGITGFADSIRPELKKYNIKVS
jgi:short-subunit dehydrogenase